MATAGKWLNYLSAQDIVNATERHNIQSSSFQVGVIQEVLLAMIGMHRKDPTCHEMAAMRRSSTLLLVTIEPPRTVPSGSEPPAFVRGIEGGGFKVDFD